MRDLSDRALVEIAARSATLDERLAATPPPGSPEDSGEAAGLVERWCHNAAGGDRGAFARRLAWDGLEEDAVRRALAAPPPEDAEPPGWTLRLREALAGGPGVAAELRGGILPEPRLFESQPPFVEVWVPFSRARRPNADREGGRKELEKLLLADLATLAELALFREFERRKTPYRSFVLDLLDGGLAAFLYEHPSLARQTMRTVDTWSRNRTELRERLAQDRDRLAGAFGARGRVAAVDPGLSDRHDGGRQVAVLTFESGVRVVYKPRGVGLEKAFHDLLAFAAEGGLAAAPRALRIVAGDGYGWVEHVAQGEAADAGEVRAWYRRAGALLCFAWTLLGRDLHMENLIATREGPVVVDAEALLEPPARGSAAERGRTALERAGERVRDSVLGTGLLSFLETDAAGRVFDSGGLLGTGGHLATRKRRVWKDVNTDAMTYAYEPATAPEQANVLRLDGGRQAPEAFAGEILAGFAAAWRFLAEHRDEVLAGPLRAFAGRRGRIVFRPSNVYAFVLYRLATPEYQRDGAARGILIDVLSRALCAEAKRPVLWPLAAEERRALQDLDVPRFTFRTDSTALVAADGTVIEDYFVRAGIEAAAERLGSLDEDGLAEQQELLRGALTRPLAHQISQAAADADDGGDGLTREELLAEARRIAGELRRRAVRGDDGALTWIAPSYLRPGEGAGRGVSYYLYDGAAGIALFFAALAATGGEDGDRETAQAALRPIAAALRNGDVGRLVEGEAIGVLNGLGSLLYALPAAARLLGDDGAVELALQAARHVTAERIRADRRLDVEGGTAGALLGLLALHAAAGEPWLLERAVVCGRHLLERRAGAAWPGEDGVARAGLAHGAAGVALALAALYRRTGDARVLAAVRGAHAFERGLFSAAEGNWAVVAKGGERVFLTAWCHGAPGIALARHAVADVAGGDGVAEDLEAALATTAAASVSEADHLCCGNFGRFEVSLTLGRRLKRRRLVEQARIRAAGRVRRGGYGQGGYGGNGPFQPGFFKGLAGIGYELLRLAAPGEVPSVLAFDAAGR